jgi:hypothetical protein
MSRPFRLPHNASDTTLPASGTSGSSAALVFDGGGLLGKHGVVGRQGAASPSRAAVTGCSHTPAAAAASKLAGNIATAASAQPRSAHDIV